MLDRSIDRRKTITQTDRARSSTLRIFFLLLSLLSFDTVDDRVDLLLAAADSDSTMLIA